MISRLALIAAAGTLLGASLAPAKAADLGGGCCADLEERVAELEATVARKGNRVVSLQIYGDVAKGLMIFDNGDESNAYVVDNDAITSILGFRGEAAMKPGWKAGFKVELAVQNASSSVVTEFNDDDSFIGIRHSNVYIESERLGRFTIGQQSSAADGAAQVNLANTLMGASPDHGTSIGIAGSGGAALGDFASDFDGDRLDLIRYDSPSIYGFIVSASWGEDDYYDIALRFAKEWNSVRIAAAIAYSHFDEEDILDPIDLETVVGSISVMHMPTGLFATGQAGQREDGDGNEASFWFVQAGLEKKFLSYGATTLYGEYGYYDDVLSLGTGEGSEADVFGFGVVQRIDSAAMDFYAQARFWSFESEVDGDLEDLSTIMLGSRIQF